MHAHLRKLPSTTTSIRKPIPNHTHEQLTGVEYQYEKASLVVHKDKLSLAKHTKQMVMIFLGTHEVCEI